MQECGKSISDKNFQQYYSKPINKNKTISDKEPVSSNKA